ncbi:MAG TPA: hypothetical protein VMD02_06650 [Candidatus Omnitrophota bacterium]|nr:hypothetical protein [Candidatus Omnitrophota bacterium]
MKTVPIKYCQAGGISRNIVDLARVMCMAEIPARTVTLLREDPYFKYCFAILPECKLYRSNDPSDQALIDRLKDFYPDQFAVAKRERLAQLLKDPASMTDRDLYFGISKYTNNFFLRLPGDHSYRGMKGIETVYGRQFRDIDRAMERLGITPEQVTNAHAASRSEKGDECYSLRLEFEKLCLRIFNEMLSAFDHKPGELRA